MSKNFKVFGFDGMDCVAASSKKEAIEFYKDYSGEYDIVDWEVKECTKDSVWKCFEEDDFFDFLKKRKEKKFLMQYKFFGNSEIIVKLSFKEVLELDGCKDPYIIASTEY